MFAGRLVRNSYRAFSWASLLLVVLSSSIQVEAQGRFERVIEFNTDSTWWVTDEEPKTSAFRRLVDYDTATGGWTRPIEEVGEPHSIWHTSIRSGQSPNRIWYRRRVFLDEETVAAIHSAELAAHFDDDGTVWVNDQVVLDDSDRVATSRVVTLPEGVFQTGWNVLAGQAIDYGGWNRVLHTLRLDVSRLRRVLPFGADWRFADDGSDLGENWRREDFDDSEWQAGAAPLGYDDPRVRTVVSYGGDPVNRHITTYFRRHVNIEGLDQYFGFELHLRRDDGAAVFINGLEATRTNLVRNATYETLAREAADDGQEVQVFGVPASLMREGSNLLAVEVHQRARDSSDVVFDLELRGILHEDAKERSDLPLVQTFDGLPVGTLNASGAESSDGQQGTLGFESLGCRTGRSRGVDTEGSYSVRDSSGRFILMFDTIDCQSILGLTAGLNVRTEHSVPRARFTEGGFVKAKLQLFRGVMIVEEIALVDTNDRNFVSMNDLARGSGQRFEQEIQLTGRDITSARLVVEGNVHADDERIVVDDIVIDRLNAFVRGDVDGTGRIDLADPIRLLSALFLGEDQILCKDAGDVDDDNRLSVTDAVWTLHWLFLSGPPPRPPFPECGIDSRSDCDSPLCEI